MDPFEIRPESGLGGRWPIRWRPGTSVEGGTRFWRSGFRVYPILAIALILSMILLQDMVNRTRIEDGGYRKHNNFIAVQVLCRDAKQK